MTKDHSARETYSYAVHPRTFDREPLTDDEIARVRHEVPDQPVKLQAGYLACRTCGQAVQRTADVGAEIVVQSLGRMTENPVTQLTHAANHQNPVTLTFGLCEQCRRAAELAEHLVDNPVRRPLRVRLGPDTALHQINCALDAVSFVSPDTVEHLAYIDAAGLVALVHTLAHLGATARWSSRFLPMMTPDADPRTCSPRSFAHLMPGARQQLRTAYAALLRERVAHSAPPVKIPPPKVEDVGSAASPLVAIDAGCLICGVDSQEVSAATVAREGREQIAKQLWTAKRVSTEQLGGRRSAQRLSGHLCKSCADAVEQAGSLGPTALMRALTTSLAPNGVGKLPYGRHEVEGLVGWGALVARAKQQNPPKPGPKPNTKPWEHLGDPAALSEQLGMALA